MSITIYFGDNDLAIGIAAKKRHPRASLLDHSNYQAFLVSAPHGVYYTSMADLPADLTIIQDILLKASLIVYYPPKKWSDGKTVNFDNVSSCIQGITESMLMHISTQIEVENLDLCFEQKYNNQVKDSRKTNHKQLWVVGCSISHGVGVAAEERYGSLLSKRLGLQCSFLTETASSVQWAANQILKADIRPGDIVCWGITHSQRLPFYYNNKLSHIMWHNFEQDKNLNNILPIDHLDNENTLYQSIESIKQVTNFCEKLQVQLVMFNALYDGRLNRILRKEKHYYQFLYPVNSNYQTYISHGLFCGFYDLGSDDLHPGPKTHKKYSDFLAHIIDTTSATSAV